MRILLRRSNVAFIVLGFGLYLTAPLPAVERTQDGKREGTELKSFSLPANAKPLDCHNYCFADEKCRAWNFLKPTKTNSPACHLLSDIKDPDPKQTKWVTGVVLYDVKFDTDLSGTSYKEIFIPNIEDETWRWNACRSLCLAQVKQEKEKQEGKECKSWTYVRWVKNDPPKDGKDKDERPRCRLNLTDTIPPEKTGEDGKCCISSLR